MAGFFKKVFSAGKGKESSAQGSNVAALKAGGPIEVASFTEFLRYFPPGEKIRYYPEFQKYMLLDSIILGYGVNNQYVYSPIDLRHQPDGERDVLKMTVDGHEVLIRDIDNFCFLIPYNKSDLNRLDIESKAALGSAGLFGVNNTITLVACSSGGTLSYVDTLVRKVISLASGIYAGHEVVVLDVLPDSLDLTDQRQHYRLQTHIPARVALGDSDVRECIIKDFSEESVRLVFDSSFKELLALTDRQRITLSVNLGTNNQSKIYDLDGVMYRKTDASLVMKLQGIYKNDSLTSIDLVDVLDIKANLLQHPATQQVLEELRNHQHNH